MGDIIGRLVGDPTQVPVDTLVDYQFSTTLLYHDECIPHKETIRPFKDLASGADVIKLHADGNLTINRAIVRDINKLYRRRGRGLNVNSITGYTIDLSDKSGKLLGTLHHDFKTKEVTTTKPTSS